MSKVCPDLHDDFRELINFCDEPEHVTSFATPSKTKDQLVLVRFKVSAIFYEMYYQIMLTTTCSIQLLHSC